ncbi:hypothetical protein CO058_03220 [candidate division WWE3 bacterium CG_4_9_14_0_2_um_filter_35_11]|uniref:Nucleotidyl transferase AbiEii/AbiGii toxin family protein n=1 Tax=candidate division WWE3 bacterium CG_4_9_14_0_2_um_filter_35_11 TaxID=1975077 RepID=A0A2M8EL82_UNCKA|nr:MAG: hypothetical protein COV25_03710 [candidate division WWE3 bacterium CG10_big_fil_rev_8_21_14_0_10_35_32]PJC23496.1 MAG: hypothetical protein CO058_03220 [candidate division WWE3 bacterium CG_4_9_14_0_2_um_filter_35_11]
MIINYINKIILTEQNKGSNPLYARSAIKEYLQILVLQYIYTNNEFKSNLIFTGGTCLRHFYGIDRLSEDLDFDCIEHVDTNKIASKIETYFKSSLKYPELKVSIKQHGKQILLKFPILRLVGIAGPNESEMLYIKIDLTLLDTKNHNVEKSSKSAFGYNFVALHYDLPSLFAGKISAILTRNLLTGKDNKQTVKGRDFYDLLWYLKMSVQVNIDLVKEKTKISNLNLDKLTNLVDDEVNLACTKYKNDFTNDLVAFINNKDFILDYVDNYLEEYKRYKITSSAN